MLYRTDTFKADLVTLHAFDGSFKKTFPGGRNARNVVLLPLYGRVDMFKYFFDRVGNLCANSVTWDESYCIDSSQLPRELSYKSENFLRHIMNLIAYPLREAGSTRPQRRRIAAAPLKTETRICRCPNDRGEHLWGSLSNDGSFRRSVGAAQPANSRKPERGESGDKRSENFPKRPRRYTWL